MDINEYFTRKTVRIQQVCVPARVRFALLDLDGTSAQCTDLINFNATQQVFSSRGIAICEADYVYARGKERVEGIELILKNIGRGDLCPEARTIAEEKNEEANKLRKALKPGDVPDSDRAVFAKLRKCGFLNALGTSSRNGLDTLNRLGLTSAFDVIVTGNEAKDKTQIWRLALGYLGASAEEAMVVEDAQTGIDAAVALGVGFSVGIGSESLRATVRAARLGDLDIELCLR